jgi:hypothetical protein
MYLKIITRKQKKCGGCIKNNSKNANLHGEGKLKIMHK